MRIDGHIFAYLKNQGGFASSTVPVGQDFFSGDLGWPEPFGVETGRSAESLISELDGCGRLADFSGVILEASSGRMPSEAQSIAATNLVRNPLLFAQAIADACAIHANATRGFDDRCSIVEPERFWLYDEVVFAITREGQSQRLLSLSEVRVLPRVFCDTSLLRFFFECSWDEDHGLVVEMAAGRVNKIFSQGAFNGI